MKKNAPNERSGSVDNSAKTSRGAKVTAPAYNGAEPSVGNAIRTASPAAPVSMAQAIMGRCGSLESAMNGLHSTLVRLGIYEPCPSAKSEATSSPAANENVLSVINTELCALVSTTLNMLRDSVFADGDSEMGEDLPKPEPTGYIVETSYGRNVYHDCQRAIDGLLDIQRLASSLSRSFIGIEPDKLDRERFVSDNVHSALCNLNEHIDDTVSILDSTNGFLANNMLGAAE